MRNENLLIIPLLSSLLAGCMMWDAGYTPNRSVSKYSVSESVQVPISYSVVLNAFDDDIAVPTRKSLCQNIERALRETGLFSEVGYGNGSTEDSYHIAFRFWLSGEGNEKAMESGLLAGYTLFLIPVGGVMTFDGDATLSLQGNPIFSSAKAEELRGALWLPLAPIGLAMNSWTVWHYLEQGTVNALVNDLAEEHKRRFLSAEQSCAIHK